MRARGEAGFTILEAVVSLVVLGVLFAILAQGVVSGWGAMSQSATMVDCQQTTQRILNYMLVDLRSACGTCTSDAGNGWEFTGDPSGAQSPRPTKVGDGYVRFTTGGGYNTTTGQRVWVGPVEYWFEYDRSKPSFTSAQVNGLGLDLDGNGKIDVGRIVRRQSGTAVVVATDVLEGFSITWPQAGGGTIPIATLATVRIGVAKQLEDNTVYATQVDDCVFLRE